VVLGVLHQVLQRPVEPAVHLLLAQVLCLAVEAVAGLLLVVVVVLSETGISLEVFLPVTVH
jgi:hypothetical protein